MIACTFPDRYIPVFNRLNSNWPNYPLMRRKASIAFHTISGVIGRTGVAKIPGARSVHQILAEFIAPKYDQEHEWIEYEGYQLKVAPGDFVSDALLRSGSFESATRDAILRNVSEGDTVVDIGAHIGSHTLSMRRATGKAGNVIAYEPHPRNAQFIRDTVEKNGFQNISVIEAALSDSNRTGQLAVESDNTGSSSLHTDQHSGSQKVEIDVRDMDEEINSASFSTIDFVKIDIQGGEFELLVGNDSFIKNIRRMVIEIHPTSYLTPFQATQVYRQLDKSGYVKDLSGQPLSEKDVVQSADDIKVYWESYEQ